jgi:hypothetical protein
MIETAKVQAQTQNQWDRDGAYNLMSYDDKETSNTCRTAA